MAQHALVTGPIAGPVPTPSPEIPGDFVDVTPPVLYFESEKVALAVADAIEDKLYADGLHPTQGECTYLDTEAEHPGGVDPDRRAAHKKAHKALDKKMGG